MLVGLLTERAIALSVCEKFHQLFSAHDKLQSKDWSLLQLLGLQAGCSLPQYLLQREMAGALIMCYGTALQVARAARTPSQTYIASPAASWLDDFLSWISPEIPRCCR